MRRVLAARRQDRIFDPWLIAGERAEEGDDRARFFGRERLVELIRRRQIDGLFQSPDLSSIELRGPQRDIAERSRAEHEIIGADFGHRATPLSAAGRINSLGLCATPNGK